MIFRSTMQRAAVRIAAGLCLALAAGCGSGKNADPAAAPRPAAEKPLQSIAAQAEAEVMAGWKAMAGTASCRPCHEELMDPWASHDHGMAMLEPSEWSIRGDFDNRTLAMADGTTATMSRRGGEWFVECSDRQGAVRPYRVDYTLGFEPIQQYMTVFPDGRIQVLPVTYDVLRGEWYELYADDIRQGEFFNHWEGPMQRWNYMCIDCHNTSAIKAFDPEQRRYGSHWFEINVGCEACHGAGAAHNRLMEAGPGSVDFAEIAPGYKGKELTQEQLVHSCGRCHARRRVLRLGMKPGDDFYDYYLPEIFDGEAYYPDGQIREEDFEFTSFSIALMFEKKVKCVDCHDPHTAVRKREGNRLCLECHQPYLNEFAHTMHEEGSEGALCERCHMPQTTYMGRDPRRDHSFSIPRPELTVEMGIPNACDRCHAEEGPQWAIDAMNAHYGERKRIEHPFARAIAAGRQSQPEGVAPLAAMARDQAISPIWRASAAALLGNYTTETARLALMEAIYDDHPLVASRAIRSLSQYLNSNVASALAPMAADERLAVKLEAISTLNRGWRLLDPENLQLLEDRKQDYLDWLKLLADDPFSYYNLGVFRMDEGRPEEALDAYAQSEALGFEETPLYVNWGMALDQTGDSEGAEDKFLKALQRDPRFAEGHFALGLLYAARPNGLGKAIQSLERAVAIKSDFARAHYNLGLAYNQAGRALEAVRSLRRAMAADPTMFEAPYALATIYYAAQQWDRAREAALQALAIQPESREAWALLDELERRQAQP